MKTITQLCVVVAATMLAGCSAFTQQYRDTRFALTFDYPTTYKLDEVREQEDSTSLFFSTRPTKGRYVTIVLRELAMTNPQLVPGDDARTHVEAMLIDSTETRIELAEARGGSELHSELYPARCNSDCCLAEGWLVTTSNPTQPSYPEAVLHLTEDILVMSCGGKARELIALRFGEGPDPNSDRFVRTVMKTLREAE